MATSQMGSLLQYLRQAGMLRDGNGLSDGELLAAFLAGRDEVAFAALVRRHAPMVLSVCRRVLRNEADAEDAFQATFLVLVRRAAFLGQPERVGNWLYGVAYRTALEAKRAKARRCAKEKQVKDMPHPLFEPELAGQEWEPLLDQELSRLSDKHRLPVVLCDLEGRTRRDVARQLNMPEGTLSNRLTAARKLLAKRLARHGVTLSGASLAVLLSQTSVTASVPSSVTIPTIKAATQAAVGKAAAGTLFSAKVAALAEGVLRAMLLTKIKITTIALLAIAAVGIGAAGLVYQTHASQPAVSQGASEQKDQTPPEQRGKPKSLIPERSADDSIAVVGQVIDEQGASVGGIRVRLVATSKYSATTTTDPQGKFRFSLPERREYTKLLIAEDADGRRQGIVRFQKLADAKGLRITLKPSRAATLRVVDARGQPVGGAQVAFFEASPLHMLSINTTRADGTAIVRYPAEASIGQVMALKSGLGFDYFSTLIGKRGSTERKPLADDVTLKLTGARTVRVKAVDSANRPVAGVPIYPWYVQQTGKPEEANLSAAFDAVMVMTDASGIAVFDWLPIDFDRAISFLSNSPKYSYVEQIAIKQEAPAIELTMRLLRRTRISGKVRGPDGRPASGIAVEAWGAGAAVHHYLGQELTRSDGSYEMLVNSEEAYIVTVVDDHWAAPSHLGVVVRKDKPVDGLDFQLGVGTIVQGTVTLGPERHPVANKYLIVRMEGGEIPAELKKPGDRSYHRVMHSRSATTDAEGKFRFCLGPGKYQLIGPMHTEPKTFTVEREREIVHNFQMPRPEMGQLVGKVVDGDGHAIAGATIEGAYRTAVGRLDIEATTAADGTFRVERVLVPTALYARTANRTQAGLVYIDSEQGDVTIRVGPVAEAEGRLLNDEGEIVAGGRVRYGIRISNARISNTETPTAFSIRFGGVATSGKDGLYKLKGLLPGEEYGVDCGYDEESGILLVLTSVKPVNAETIPLADTRIPKPHRRLTLEDKTIQFFKQRGNLSERIAKAQAEAKSHYLRVLLIIGDWNDMRTRKWIELRETNDGIRQALLEYEQLAVAADDARAIAVLREDFALDADQLKSPSLIVLGEDRKIVAAKSSLLLDGNADSVSTDIKEFLASYALPRRDAQELLADALDRARRDGKRVFLQETGTYCSWCRVLSHYLGKHRAILDPNYVFVEVDRSRFVHGDEVMKRYRTGKDRSIPWCAILDAEGKMIANWDGPKGNIGYPGEPQEIEHFLHALTVTAPRLTPAQLIDLRQDLERKR